MKDFEVLKAMLKGAGIEVREWTGPMGNELEIVGSLASSTAIDFTFRPDGSLLAVELWGVRA